MTLLPEHESEKAARILAVAGELVLRRGVKGVTVAEIAEKAHVGKGTAYQYWETKEDLFVGLFARDFLATVDEYEAALTADSDLARPHRLFPKAVRTTLDHPFVRAVLTADVDLLGVLANDPRSKELLNTLGPAALAYEVLPVLRRHGLARTDWPLEEQAYALCALIDGFIHGFVRASANADILPNIEVDSPDKVMGAAVTALLGPETASPEDVGATAREGLRLLAEKRQATLALITPTRD
ncbi:TetR/AcrR family transcriptional regulator [Saccharothrix deserti]|uniref:TetR/AcrR family transcriptional regulator n=1 Tax=Saccharothrix deserti TaxID=2593674 RepID=UPI00131AF0D9|nr:TetR/AcrR family transcriptional regulator [Saccharothrix deserti]